MEWDELRCARPHPGERGGISIGNGEKRPVVAVDAAGDVEKETFQRAIADAEPLEAPLPITDDHQDIGKKFAIPPWKTSSLRAPYANEAKAVYAATFCNREFVPSTFIEATRAGAFFRSNVSTPVAYTGASSSGPRWR